MTHRPALIKSVVLAACILLATVACSSPPEPMAPAVTLPAFWDGAGGGLFEFYKIGKTDHTPGVAYTDRGVMTIEDTNQPVIWSWDGHPTNLKLSVESPISAVSFLVRRDGRWYVTTRWVLERKAEGNTLGGGSRIQGVTTWDDSGSIVFDGELDAAEPVLLDPKGYAASGKDYGYQEWTVASPEGFLVSKAAANGREDTDNRDIVTDPMTGWVIGVPATKSPSTVPGYEKVNDLDVVHNPSLTATGAWATSKDSVTITNTKTGATTVITKADATCGEDTSQYVALIRSSFNGRYIMVGRYVLDTETNTSSCLDAAGSPQLTAITSMGVGYGDAQQNGKRVFISYDITTGAVTVLPDVVTLPTFIGPNDVAVVEPESDESGMAGVYRTAST